MRSFRLKIGLLSVALSGGVLLAFGAYFLAVIERLGTERVDRELRLLADPQVRRPQPPEHWDRFTHSFESLYGAAAARQFIFRVTDRHGHGEYVSAHWPTALTVAALPSLPTLPPDTARARPPRHPARELDDVASRPPPNAAPPRPPPQPPWAMDDLVPSRPPGGPPPPLALRGPLFATLPDGHTAWRVIVIGNPEIELAIGMDLSVLRAETRRFRWAFLISLPLALLLLVAAASLLTRTALRPVHAIAHTAAAVTARRLDQRIPEAGADREFRDLVAVINGMLERLERSFRQATRFSADAAHELKTPLTVLQGEVEQALRQAPDGSPEQRAFGGMLEEVQRLKAIVRKLLLLAQADAGTMPVGAERVDLACLVTAVADDARILAPTATVAVEAPPTAWVRGDPDLLNQAFLNLASNAAKFNDARGLVSLALCRDAGRYVFTISNTGPGIPPADRSRVFERFYRADAARTRATDGVGLGLSLAREIARAHGGDLVLAHTDADRTTFVLTLPAAD